MSPFDEKRIYQALALPNEAIADGGVEILRAGIIDDELFVSARHAFRDPAKWGEVLASVTRRLGILYAAETDLSEKEAIAEIEGAYAAEMGAPVIEEKPRKKSARPKPKAPGKRAAPKRSPAKSKRAAAASTRSPPRGKR